MLNRYENKIKIFINFLKNANYFPQTRGMASSSDLDQRCTAFTTVSTFLIYILGYYSTIHFKP